MNGGAVQLTARPGNGNDTFNALADGMLAAGDTLDGLGGTDTLISRHTITDDKTIAPSTKNIEIHKVRLDADGGAGDDVLTYDMGDVVGATEVWSYRSNNSGATSDGVLTFSGSSMTTAVALGIQGGDTGAANSSIDVTAVYQNVTGSADSSKLMLNGAAADTVTIADIETLNIVTSKTETSASSKGDSKLNSLVAVNATVINVSGDGKLTLSATDFDDTLGYKVDASTATGAVIATLEASTKQTFIGGSGNDEVFVAASVETTDSFDGGAGTADVFGHTEGTDVAAKVTNIKNFEVLDVTGSSAQTYNLSFYDGSTIDTVRATGAITTSVTVNKMMEGGTLLLTGNTGAVDLTANHTSIDAPGFTGGTLKLKYASDAAVLPTTVTLGGAATVNIEVGAKTAGTAKASITHKVDTNLVGSMMTKLNVSGDQNLTIDGFAGSTALVNIDARTMTGSLIFAEMAGTGSTLIKSGAGDDTLTPNDGAVAQVWGGAGADTIAMGATGAAATYVINSALDGNSSLGTLTGGDVVTGFIRTEDKIGISESFLATLGNKDSTLNALVISSANFTVGSNDVIVATHAGAATPTLANLVTQFGTITGSSVGLELILAAETNAATGHKIYHFKDLDGDGVLDAGEVTLIGSITSDSGDLAAADFVKVTGTYAG